MLGGNTLPIFRLPAFRLLTSLARWKHKSGDDVPWYCDEEGDWEGNPATARVVHRAVNLAYDIGEERARLAAVKVSSVDPRPTIGSTVSNASIIQSMPISSLILRSQP